jgi:hypothetical protein
MDTTGEDWHLASGIWRRDSASDRWLPVVRANGHQVSDRLSPQERLELVNTAKSGRSSGAGPASYPAEFVFSPDNGERLTPTSFPASAPWTPPSGAPLGRPRTGQVSEARGLRQTTRDFKVTQRPRSGNKSRREATDDPDRTIAAPPPGQYELAVGRFATDCDVLVAIEPERGAMFVWLPIAKNWEPLVHDGGGLLAEASVPSAQWTAELLQDGDDTILCLPTNVGLAVVRPDCLALTFSVSYLGDGSALGSPVLWGSEVWAPVRQAGGAIALLAVAKTGQPVRTQVSSIPAPNEAFGEPVCDAQQIIWPSQSGQLVVRKGPDGAAQPTWVEWPSDTQPKFGFGSPYLSTTGRFWQLCWSRRNESYAYVQMGRTGAEIFPTNAPALCTGRRSYKLAARMKGDPWMDPPDASDSSSNDIVVPLLESSMQGAVLGLVVDAERGVTALLESNERQRAVVQFQSDHSADVQFQTLIVAMPWRTRVAVYDGCVWMYHPDLQVIVGTELEALA